MWKTFIAWLKELFGFTKHESVSEEAHSFAGALPDVVDERDQTFNHSVKEK